MVKIKVHRFVERSSHLKRSGEQMSSNQMAGITSQWWCRLVNAYEVKAGMVC